MASETKFVFYYYVPNRWVCLHYAVLFGLLAIYQFSSAFMTKRKYGGMVSDKCSRSVFNIVIPFLIGILMEVTGYVARFFSSFNTDNMAAYVVQSIMLLVAPAFLAATIYMYFGRIISSMDAGKYCFIPIRYVTKIFVTGDIISFLMQSSGGGLSAKATTQDSVNMAKNLIVGGLGVQILFFGVFNVLLLIFFVRIHRKPTWTSSDMKKTMPAYGNWQHCMLALVVSSALIMIRSIFRLIEYMEGREGELQSKEVYLFAFDSALILVSVCVMVSCNFSRFLLSAASNAANR